MASGARRGRHRSAPRPGVAIARAVNLSQKLRRSRNDSASACTRGRQARAASAQRANPFGINASILARMAWANTGAAPSVEMPMTSGDRLTMAPKAKSENAGRSMTLTGTPARRAAAANSAAAASSAQSATAIAAPAKSLPRPTAFVDHDRPARRRAGKRAASPRSAPAQRPRLARPPPKAIRLSTPRPRVPPATMARLPSSEKNTGNRDKAAMRGGVAAGMRSTITAGQSPSKRRSDSDRWPSAR